MAPSTGNASGIGGNAPDYISGFHCTQCFQPLPPDDIRICRECKKTHAPYCIDCEGDLQQGECQRCTVCHDIRKALVEDLRRPCDAPSLPFDPAGRSSAAADQTNVSSYTGMAGFYPDLCARPSSPIPWLDMDAHTDSWLMPPLPLPSPVLPETNLDPMPMLNSPALDHMSQSNGISKSSLDSSAGSSNYETSGFSFDSKLGVWLQRTV
ncbi:hypothetical protein B0J13DRAFT_634821 [Dactylonectria estremocensis]|uniref:Uncharacterized protein n=1 Tax=Dactylonectria estremocensis TaxID=1079267 RepID=A0A9P9FMA5_9HYPO|nr:hypothetical protein B0J13DRAFT_634821 [Dactylonectria estremocensis]